MRHEGNEVYMGSLAECDLDHNFAVVAVSDLLDIRVGPIQCALKILPYGEVLLAVGRGISGEIIARSVELNGDSGI